MRTTLTLDDDVAVKLRAEARRSGEPFKQIVNRVLRTGLNIQLQAASLPPFKVKARSLGNKGFNYDKVWELIEQAEGALISMILIDANLLLYASDTDSVHHQTSRRWLETTLSGPEPVGLAWVALLAFVRVGTNPRIRKDAFSFAEAAAIVSAWLERPMVTLLNPGERHWETLRDLMTRGQARGSLIMDAHLAALAIEHGATLATSDRDFARFPGLKFFNPLDKP